MVNDDKVMSWWEEAPDAERCVEQSDEGMKVEMMCEPCRMRVFCRFVIV